MKKITRALSLLLAVLLLLCSCGAVEEVLGLPEDGQSEAETAESGKNETGKNETGTPDTSASISGTTSAMKGSKDAKRPAAAGARIDPGVLPSFSGTAYCTVNRGIPTFSENELSLTSYEYYSPLDRLGRCGYTVASVATDLMPTGARGSISSVKPSGWVQAQYDCVNGKYLYNRCHLIGWQLTGENANKQNLITGTRYLNEAMIPYENMVADYVKETKNHVMYRVEPIFIENDLVATGVHMEAWSVEDGGDGICFNVFLYNVQPGVSIDYATGNSRLAGTAATFLIGPEMIAWLAPEKKTAA